MAYDKVVDSAQLDADLKVVADAIREKGGTTELLEFPQGMKQAVEAIQSGGSSGELITMTSSCTTADVSTAIFQTLAENDTQSVIFRYVGNEQPVLEATTNQCMYFLVLVGAQRVGNEVFLVKEYAQYRWKSLGNIKLVGANTSAYDVVINLGDVYEKVVVG